MNGLANIIVGLWFVPVTLYAIIPLTMLFGWLISRLIGWLFVPQKSRRHVTQKQVDQGVGTDIFLKTAT